MEKSKTAALGDAADSLRRNLSLSEEHWASSMAQRVKAYSVQEAQEMWVQSVVRKIPWRTEWQPTPLSLPEKFHGQRRLAGLSLKDHRELDTTE